MILARKLCALTVLKIYSLKIFALEIFTLTIFAHKIFIQTIFPHKISALLAHLMPAEICAYCLQFSWLGCQLGLSAVAALTHHQLPAIPAT